MKDTAEQEIIEIGDLDVEAFNEYRRRAGLERRHAALRADRGQGGEVRRDGARRQPALCARAAAPDRADPAEPRRQCGDGGLQAGIFPGGDGGHARRARSRVQSARHARHHPFLRAHGHGERADPPRARHQLRLQLLRPGLAAQRHDRPRARPDAAQHRRRQAGRDGPLDPGQSRQVHLLLRRERGRESLDALSRAARLRARPTAW